MTAAELFALAPGLGRRLSAGEPVGRKPRYVNGATELTDPALPGSRRPVAAIFA